MIEPIALLLTAWLFGGMTLFAAGFARVLYAALPAATAGTVLRQAFPRFYGFVILAAGAAAALLAATDAAGAMGLAVIAVTAIPARQFLTPAINAATDAGRKRQFKLLHGLAVGLTLAHIGIAAWALTRFAV